MVKIALQIITRSHCNEVEVPQSKFYLTFNSMTILYTKKAKNPIIDHYDLFGFIIRIDIHLNCLPNEIVFLFWSYLVS